MEELPSLDDAIESIAAPDASEDTLRSIVERHRRRQVRALAGGLLVVLVAGPALGWALGRSTEGDGARDVQAASGQPTPPAPEVVHVPPVSASEMGSMGDPGFYGPPAATRLFLRDTEDRIRIRAYTSDLGSLPPGLEGENADAAACRRPTQLFHAQISDDFVADNGTAPVMTWTPEPAPVTLLDVGLVGVAEGSPILRVGLRTSPEVAAVRLRRGDATADQMAPVDGWAVLASHVDGTAEDLFRGPPEGVVEALDASGAVLATVDLAAGPGPEIPAECRPPMPPPPDGIASETAPARPILPGPTTVSVP
ncbi:MAG: hypothetical protein ABR540_07015 [Acidimicrobiales bacterium]